MKKKLLLHVCCGPDATIPWPELQTEEYEVLGYFYGGNIHPQEEYVLRTQAVLSVAESCDAVEIFPEYDPSEWFRRTEHLAGEPEGGSRCSLCFRIQLEAAAQEALRQGCQYLCTTLTISPHKDPELINGIGLDVASSFGLIWVDRVWRKTNGFVRSVHRSKELGLYRQNYCGCIYSCRNRDDLS